MRRKCTHEHTGPAEASRLSLRDGFTAYFVLSPVTGFLATVACERIHKLDASTGASGPHDFAVRISAVRRSAPPASTASRAALMTLANAPSVARDARLSAPDLPDGEREIFLLTGLDRRKPENEMICPSGCHVGRPTLPAPIRPMRHPHDISCFKATAICSSAQSTSSLVITSGGAIRRCGRGCPWRGRPCLAANLAARDGIAFTCQLY
jgi:hypothetical protein